MIRLDQIEGSHPRQIVEIDPPEAPRLVVLNSALAGQEFACVRSELKIGRTDENDIQIDHRSLSRTHAKVVREENGDWRVIDLQSANGLKINGEPYAQATLRGGDVLELGHLKLRFVAAGETFQFVLGGEPEKAAPRKSFGTLAALSLVAVAGGAAGAWYLGLLSFSNPPPMEEPVAAKVAPPTPPAPIPPVPPVSQPPLEETLAAAQDAIEARQWDLAERLLESCKNADGSLEPSASELLDQLKDEGPLKRNLESADKLILANRLDDAQQLLEASLHTKLLTSYYDELRERWRGAAEKKAAKIAKATPAKPAQPTEPTTKTNPTPVKLSGEEEAKRLYDEGYLLLKNKQYREARVQLERCLKQDPAMAACHKVLGAANAKLNEAEKGAYHYRKFLELAPNDKDADKVRNIIEAYENNKSK